LCGICGYVGNGQAAPVLREMLRVMERHRLGFESAGIATVCDGKIVLRKGCGSVEEVFPLSGDWSGFLRGGVGVGHVRYPSQIMSSLVGEDRFAHPFLSCDGGIALVHNGAVNDYREIWGELGGHVFSSFDERLGMVNDSEVIVHLLEDDVVESRGDVVEAVRETYKRLVRNPLNQLLFAFVCVAEPSKVYVVSGREWEGKRKVLVAYRKGFGSVFASYRDVGIDGCEPLGFGAVKPFVVVERDDVEVLPYDTLAVLSEDGYEVSRLC